MSLVNPDPYLRSDRDFPIEADELNKELDRTYLDIANAVNSREIGIYAQKKFSVTGQSWYLTTEKQQTLRQVFQFTSTASIPHNLSLSKIRGITKMEGTYSDGSSWYGLIAGSSVSLSGQISFYLDSSNIVFVVDAGAPSLSTGIIILEWLSEI